MNDIPWTSEIHINILSSLSIFVHAP